MKVYNSKAMIAPLLCTFLAACRVRLTASQSAAQMVDFKVYPIDSKIGSYPMMKMIEIGSELIEQGHDVEEVVTAIKKMTKNTELAFIPANLKQLHKSGRVSGTQAFLSSLLNIKVIITFEDGKPVMKEKVRANKRARKNITDLLRSDMTKGTVPEIAVIHCNNTNDARCVERRTIAGISELKNSSSPSQRLRRRPCR